MAFVLVDDATYAFEKQRKEDRLKPFQSLPDYFEDNYIELVLETNWSYQSLILPIGTFLIGFSLENLVQLMHWSHRMAASKKSCQQSTLSSPSSSDFSKMSKGLPKKCGETDGFDVIRNSKPKISIAKENLFRTQAITIEITYRSF